MIQDCPALTPAPPLSVTLPDVLITGNTAQYACPHVFSVLYGDVTRTCASESWTGVEPSCVPGKSTSRHRIMFYIIILKI